MLISINQELRLHIPSNAVDDVTLLSGIIDNSEKDFLRDKLGTALYDSLCEYYDSIDPLEFYNNVVNGTYTQDPWAELLLNAQRMICNDALARFAYQQVISVNGSGINVVSGNDYGNADDRLLDKGVGGYKKEAAIACNNLLILLEDWSKLLSAPMPIEEGLDNPTGDGTDNPTGEGTETTVPDGSPSGIDEELGADAPGAAEGTDADGDTSPSSVVDAHAAIEEIVLLWQQSKYFYLHADLLIPTAHVLQHYLDIYENRDKFIRLLPDLRFIQDEYIEDAFGEDFVREMLATVPDDSSSGKTRLLRKVRRLITAYLEQRTTVLAIDKVRRQQAHDEAISLKENILAYLKSKEQPSSDATEDGVSTPPSSTEQGYKNNAQGSRIFVSPLLY